MEAAKSADMPIKSIEDSAVNLWRRWGWLPVALGVVAALLWVVADGRSVWSPITATDIDQHRANTPLPPLDESLHSEQTFTPGRDGLAEIDIFLSGNGRDGGENGRLTLQLHDAAQTIVHETSLPTHNLTDNQTYTLKFPPQPHSAGQTYTLLIGGQGDNPMSVWGYSLDVYAGGTLRLQPGALDPSPPQTAAQDLRFTTRYQLTLADALRSLGARLLRAGGLLTAALLFLPLPGVLLLLAGPPAWRRWDAAAWWGIALALGIAGWAMVWQWVSLVNGRFSGVWLWVLVAGGWMLVALRIADSKRRRPKSALRPPQFAIEHLLLLALLLIGFAVRLLAVRDLAFPPWVDASRHALITAVMITKGQIPDNYVPYLPVDHFPYHFGFHTLSASLVLMTGDDLPTLLLILGQLLNALIPLTIYAAAWLFTRRRRAGLVAAFLVALPFFFPAYYLSWGRLTQLTAVLLMPILMGLTWRLMRGGRQERRVWWLVGVLAAGIFLVHFRVFLFYLPFAWLVWLVSWGRNGRWLAAATALAVFLASPHMVNLLRVTEPVATVQRTMANYNDFPVAYLNVAWERPFLYLTGIAFLLLLIPALRRRHWTMVPLFLAGWVAVLFILLSGERVGLPETSLVNINSLYITTFIPQAIFLGIVTDRFWRWLGRRHWLGQSVGRFVTGAAVTAVFIFGVRQQMTVLNAQTELAQPSDIAGLDWLADNLPPNAKIAANSWHWLGATWAGSDGGAWILPVTGLETTMPPIDHIYNREYFQQIREFNAAATAVTDWADPASANWLREQGVTHVYVGARGGFFDPAALARNPEMHLRYGRDGVFVFEIGPPP